MKLSAYLIDAVGRTYEDLFNSDSSPTLIDKSELVGFDCRIAIGNCNDKTPEWLNFLKPIIEDDINLSSYKNASTRAVVIVRTTAYYVAYTFGFGRYLLDDNLIIKDFGIKVALNGIDPEKVKGMDKLTISDNMMQQRIQSSKDAGVQEFAIDINRDYMRTVAGTTKSSTISNRLYGSDSIQFSKKIEFTEFSSLSNALVSEYLSDSYKTNFSWFDNMRIERDKTTLIKLDNQLAARLNSGQGIYLVAPEIVDDYFIDKMSLTENGAKVPFDIEELINFFALKNITIDIDNIKKRYVYIYSENSAEYDVKWRLYDCILTDVELAGELYTFMMGQWFKVDTDFKANLYAYLKTIPESTVNLPNANRGECEGDYSIRACALNPDMLLLDRKCVGKVEICDILTKKKQFIHIKPWKSSSTLSHLFAQGKVSSTLLLEDKKFRADAKKKISGINKAFDVIEKGNIDPSSYEIVFAIIYSEKKAVIDRLPFFSKVNLKETAEALSGMNFNVSVKQIVRV